MHLNYVPGSYEPYVQDLQQLSREESEYLVRRREWADAEGEGRRAPLRLSKDQRINVPAAIAHFLRELPIPPRAYVERGCNVIRWSEYPRGGHFAAAEEPELLAADIRSFVARLR